MYICGMCDSRFSEPESREYCYEEYCGVSSMFTNMHYGTYGVCPYCGAEDITDYVEEEDVEFE